MLKRFKIKLLALPAITIAALLAGCTVADVVSNVTTACASLGTGIEAVATIAGQPTISQFIASVSNDCPTFANAVGAVVGIVTGQGQTASVSIAAQAQTPAAMRRLGPRRTVFHFTVDPSGKVTIR